MRITLRSGTTADRTREVRARDGGTNGVAEARRSTRKPREPGHLGGDRARGLSLSRGRPPPGGRAGAVATVRLGGEESNRVGAVKIDRHVPWCTRTPLPVNRGRPRVRKN